MSQIYFKIGEIIAGDVVCQLWSWYRDKVGSVGSGGANANTTVGGIGVGGIGGTMTPSGTGTYHRHIHAQQAHGGLDFSAANGNKQGGHDFV